MAKTKADAPLYHKLKERILELIESGRYRPGDRLPTEYELCEQFEVSRTTVRQALHHLKLEGHIEQTQGKGTFVASSKIQQPLSSYISFDDYMKRLGLSGETKVLEFSVVPATAQLAKMLNVAETDPLFKLIRMRYVDRTPLKYSITYIPWKVAPGLAFEETQGSLYDVFRSKYGHQLSKCVDWIEPILTDDQFSEYLEVAVGAPALMVRSVTYDTVGVPLEHSQEIFRGDRSKFVLERDLQSPSAKYTGLLPDPWRHEPDGAE